MSSHSDPEELFVFASDRLVWLLSHEGRDRVDITAEQLFLRVRAVSDRTMRPALIREFLTSQDDAMFLAVLDLLLGAANNGHATAREVVQELGLDPGVVSELPYDRVQELYSLANEAELHDVATYLLSPRVNRKQLDRAYPENEHLSLPLGVRRQAARGQDRNLLDRLLHDRDHRVIALLLDNPRLTERDAVRIAAQRPTTAAVLEAVAKNRRWSSRYRVRKALVFNPYTPEGIATRLLPTLMIQDLRFIASSGVLLPEVQSTAQSILRERETSGR